VEGRVVRARDRDQARRSVVLRAATTWAFISMSSGRPVRIPEQLVAAFS
jgi:acyl-CoA thioesterase FadM